MGGDLALRPIQELELGFRMQFSGMITEGDVSRSTRGPSFWDPDRSPAPEKMLEHGRAHLSVSPWISVHLFTDALGWDVLGGTYRGLETSVGFAL